MIQIILLVLTIALTLYGILLVRSFEYMSITELKRQARAGNADAKAVYPVRVYGMQLWMLLWAILGFLTSSIILLFHSLVGPYWTILINVPFIVLIHAVLPWTRRPKPNLHMAAVVSPYIEKVLVIMFPVLRFFEKWIGRWIQPEPILLIQSKDELLEILRHNADEFDHINRNELKIAENAMTFGEKTVGDCMTPLNTVNFISAKEQLTPVVLGELHDSGHACFPVYQGSNQNIVGSLFLRDVLKSKGNKSVNEVMRSDVYYINETQTLDYALKAFLKTRHHIFVVVNEFEDVVGLLSIDDVLAQIIGHTILDEFNQFDDLRAVAKQTAKQKQTARELEHV